jgi:pimeloyl-ACP methyl ester carboxylesterase
MRRRAIFDFAFIHGGGQGGWVWGETIAALQSQSDGAARCLAIDAPGCGAKRHRDTSQIAYGEIVAEFVAELEGAGLRDVVLVGHSQAGMVLPLVADARPDLIKRLVYVTCSAPLPGVTTLELMGQGVHGQNPEQVGWPVDPATHTMEQRHRIMFCNDMNAAVAEAFLVRLGGDAWPMCCYSERGWRYDHLAAIPSTYVLCLRDEALPLSWQELFTARLHCDRLVRLDAGHQAMNTRPQALAEILLAEVAA